MNSNPIIQPYDFRLANKVGSQANWNADCDQDTIIRRHILIRHLWMFNSEEFPWITDIFMKKATASRIMELLNTDHTVIDRIEYNNKLWELQYILTTFQQLEEADKRKDPTHYLISFRENSIMNIYVALVRKLTYPVKNYVREL